MTRGSGSYHWAMAFTAGSVFAICAVVTLLGHERKGVVYGATPEAPGG